MGAAEVTTRLSCGFCLLRAHSAHEASTTQGHRGLPGLTARTLVSVSPSPSAGHSLPGKGLGSQEQELFPGREQRQDSLPTRHPDKAPVPTTTCLRLKGVALNVPSMSVCPQGQGDWPSMGGGGMESKQV